MLKAKIKIHAVEIQEAMDALYNLRTLPFKIRGISSTSFFTTFWIEVPTEEQLFEAITYLNKSCPYGGAVVLKLKHFN